MRRILAGLVLGLLASILTVSAAWAQYEDDATIVMSDRVVSAGDSTTVSGDNCPPNSTVTFHMVAQNGTTQQVGSTTADSTGHYSSSVTIPTTTAPGRYTLEARCGTEVAGTQFTVAAEQARAVGTGTARTGTDAVPLAGAGVALVGAGAGLVALARRRRSARSAA